jgi:hypothetical protein
MKACCTTCYPSMKLTTFDFDEDCRLSYSSQMCLGSEAHGNYTFDVEHHEICTI